MLRIAPRNRACTLRALRVGSWERRAAAVSGVAFSSRGSSCGGRRVSLASENGDRGKATRAITSIMDMRPNIDGDEHERYEHCQTDREPFGEIHVKRKCREKQGHSIDHEPAGK